MSPPLPLLLYSLETQADTVCHRGKTVQTLFKTEGRSLRENYATLFGAKSAAPLLDLDLELEVEAAKRVLKMAGLDEL